MDFIKWMKEHKAWTEYKENYDLDDDVHIFLEGNKPQDYLDSGFAWEDTNDVNFWVDLNKEWLKHINELKDA